MIKTSEKRLQSGVRYFFTDGRVLINVVLFLGYARKVVDGGAARPRLSKSIVHFDNAEQYSA